MHCALKQKTSERNEEIGYTVDANAEIVSKAVSIYNKYRNCNSRSLVVAAIEFVRGFGDFPRFFVFFEAHSPEQSGHHAPCATRGGRRHPGRADDHRHLGVAVAVLSSQEHDTTVGPPEADADSAGQEKAEEGEENPVLTHLQRK